MKRLCLHEVNKEECQEIVSSLNAGSMPNLTTLEIFMWNFVTNHSNLIYMYNMLNSINFSKMIDQ